MKQIIVFGLFLMLSSVGVALTVSQQQFDADFCVNGHGSSWVNACVCSEPTQFTGIYCDNRLGPVCQKNQDCPNNQFCAIFANANKCAPLVVRHTVTDEKGTFALSDYLLNYDSAIQFCQSLGDGYRLATRADFDCQASGPACLALSRVLLLQETFTTRGFFWLDEKDEKNAYYADFNDGTVYSCSKSNIKTTQALCIKEHRDDK